MSLFRLSGVAIIIQPHRAERGIPAAQQPVMACNALPEFTSHLGGRDEGVYVCGKLKGHSAKAERVSPELSPM
jgi:hypothetical protein